MEKLQTSRQVHNLQTKVKNNAMLKTFSNCHIFWLVVTFGLMIECFHGVGQRSLSLDWATRYDICLGIARGLAYLHEESRLRIVHRDVKASNILLDSDFTPKISDFGLAKLYDDRKTHKSTRVAGTV